MTKYLRDQPFQVGGSTEAYRDGWDRIFGKKCVVCRGTGEIEQARPTISGISIVKVTCTVCGGTGKERQP